MDHTADVGSAGGLGNGASYTYYTTPVLGPTDTCAGMTVPLRKAVSTRGGQSCQRNPMNDAQ